MIYNRRRTFITVCGMAWGIATVVLLLAYGAGFGQAIQNIFAQWGTYLIGVFPGRTSEQVGGSKAGVQVRLTQDDVDRLWATVPGVTHISPAMFKQVNVASDEHMYSWQLDGYRAEIADILKLDIDQGRFYTDQDDADRAHVAVLGSEAKSKLFGGRYALGQRIRLNGIGFTVIGVLEPKMQEGDDDVNRQVYIPLNTFQDFGDTKYLGGIWLTYHGDNQVVEQAVRNTPGRDAQFPALRPQCHLRREPHAPAPPVPGHHHRAGGAAALHRRADPGHRRHRPHEHHAGRRPAAHPRDRHRESPRRAPPPHPLPVPL